MDLAQRGASARRRCEFSHAVACTLLDAASYAPWVLLSESSTALSGWGRPGPASESDSEAASSPLPRRPLPQPRRAVATAALCRAL